MPFTILLLSLAQAAPTPVWDSSDFSNAASWKALETGTVTLESRPVSGTAYFEYRASIAVTGSTTQLCAAVFDWVTTGPKHPDLEISKLVNDAGDRRSVYQRTRNSVVSPRDLVVTSMRRIDDKGVCRIRGHATNELAPPLEAGVVRMDQLWTSWTFEPAADGQTKVSLIMFSNPAGSVPAFIVHGTQRSSTRQTLLAALESARAAK